ncbi:glucosamine-6-phosphate deaminase [Salmonella enterica]|nr:glucosamine-6-phosphate deaminase [Salmonella enterica]
MLKQYLCRFVLNQPDDAPRDKCAHFREINGIAAAFQYLQKNYNPTASSFL